MRVVINHTATYDYTVAYDAYRSAVDAELRSAFADREGMLYDILRYHLGWVDERGNAAAGRATPLHFSAALAMSCADAVSGDFRPAATVGAAVELVSNFVLVHNDVQAGRVDRVDDRPSIWWVWGPAQAINAGDGLHALARAVLMRWSDAGTPAETVLDALRSLDQACLTLCEGQYMDLTYQDELMVVESAYLDMIERKSGALAGCAARLGGVAAGANPDTCAALQEWGVKLGMAMQIYADIGDLWGSRGDGMTASNVLNKKKSLPVIHALTHAPAPVKRELGGIYMKRVLEPDDARRLAAILTDVGARAYAEDKARGLLDEAVAALDGAGAAIANREPLTAAAALVASGSAAALS